MALYVLPTQPGKESAGFFLRDTGVLNDAKILAAISYNDDHVAFSDDEAGVVEKVEDSDTRALERDDVEHLARAAAGDERRQDPGHDQLQR